MGRTARLYLRKAVFLCGFYKKAGSVAVQPAGQQQQSPSLGAAGRMVQTLVRAMRSRDDVNNNNNNSNLLAQTRDAADSDQAATLNAYLRNGNQVGSNERPMFNTLSLTTHIHQSPSFN